MSERFHHQIDTFNKTKDLDAFALFWQVRVGKTYPVLDTAYYRAANKQIDTVLIWTKNGNHLKFGTETIPAYIKEMGDAFKSRIFVWESDQSKRVGFIKAQEDAVKHQGLLWVCVNFEALMLDRVEDWLVALMNKRHGTMLIVDESHRLKTPSASTTKAALRMSKYTKPRRLMTGSPSPKNPFDLWSQCEILDPKIFNMRFTAFKTHYGIWKRMKFGPRSFDALDIEQGDRGFKNLDEMNVTLKPVTSRLLRKEVFPNEPKCTPEKVYFELSPKQRKAFDELKNEMMTTLDSGQVITTSQAIVCVMRLQQIARGFVGQTGEEGIDLGGPYPALEALTDYIDSVLIDFQLKRKVIVWCRFTPDVDMVIKHLTKEGYGECVRYDGQVKVAQRLANVDRFQKDPKVRVLVGNPAAGTEGQSMTAGCATIYYSYSYNLIDREQSEGRPFGPDQKEPTVFQADIVARDTMDDIVLQNLLNKKDLAAIITGDINRFKEMLRSI